MTKLPSIAILHYTLPPVVGGVESVILAQARAFIRAGYPVTLIAGRGQRDALPQHSELMLVPELDTRHAEIAKISESLANGEVPESFTPAVEKLIDSLYPILKRFDHVIIHNVLTKHSNLPLTAALIRLIEMGAIRHAIAWCHDISWTSPGSREKVQPGYPWDLLRTPLGDVTYVAVSEKRQRELADLFNMEPEMIHLVYNGVEPRTLLGFSTEGMELIERLGLLNSDLTLLMPVRITPSKNIEYALSVLAHLRMACQNPRLVVTGPPEPHNAKNIDYFESLLVMRDRLGVARHAEFVYECGPNAWEPYTISESVMAELFRISDVVFIPSLREGFGMPVLEAGLCGIPVISTDTVPASLEIGKQDVSMFSADLDPQDMALKILSLVNRNPISHLRRRLRKGYTWQALFQRAIEPLLIEEKSFA